MAVIDGLDIIPRGSTHVAVAFSCAPRAVEYASTIMSECLFCKIRDGKINSRKVFEDEQVFAFEDIYPQAPTHILVVPKQHIASVNEVTETNKAVIGHMFYVANQIARERSVSESGYRLVINTNSDAGQTVFHIHLHVMGGRPFQWPPG